MARESGLYDCLDVGADANEAEIKKAFRKMAMRYHPDKNPGHEEKFKEASMAYEVLSNPEKRKIYDKFGMDGLRSGGGGGGGGGHFGAEDLFAHFFGGGGFPGGGGRVRKGEDHVRAIPMSLEDLYNGRTLKLSVERSIMCSPCSGKGTLSGNPTTCIGCRGRGVRQMLVNLVGMYQRIEQPCLTCGATGEAIRPGDRCKICCGQKAVLEQTVLDVHIDKGMSTGTKIVFDSAGDHVPGGEASDIILVVQQMEHQVFRRDGRDLHVVKSISLHEALCGFEFTLTHLDGRVLHILSEPGAIIKPGDIRCIMNEGMPTHKRPYDKGRLIVSFQVEFPTSIPSVETLQQLMQHVQMPRRSIKEELASNGLTEDDVEYLTLADLHHSGGSGSSSAHQRHSHDDSNDEEGSRHTGHPLQCAQQ